MDACWRLVTPPVPAAAAKCATRMSPGSTQHLRDLPPRLGRCPCQWRYFIMLEITSHDTCARICRTPHGAVPGSSRWAQRACSAKKGGAAIRLLPHSKAPPTGGACKGKVPNFITHRKRSPSPVAVQPGRPPPPPTPRAQALKHAWPQCVILAWRKNLRAYGAGRNRVSGSPCEVCRRASDPRHSPVEANTMCIWWRVEREQAERARLGRTPGVA
jgi:hypothetical protein